MTKLTFLDWSELVWFKATFSWQREHCAVQQDKITRPLISSSVWNILKYFMISPMLWSSLTILTHLSYPARPESMKGWVGSMMDACKEEKANALWKGVAYEEPFWWMTVVKFRFSKHFVQTDSALMAKREGIARKIRHIIFSWWWLVPLWSRKAMLTKYIAPATNLAIIM